MELKWKGLKKKVKNIRNPQIEILVILFTN